MVAGAGGMTGIGRAHASGVSALVRLGAGCDRHFETVESLNAGRETSDAVVADRHHVPRRSRMHTDYRQVAPYARRKAHKMYAPSSCPARRVCPTLR